MNKTERKEPPLCAAVPVQVRRALAELVDPDAALCLAVATDIKLDGQYGEAWLMATDDLLRGELRVAWMRSLFGPVMAFITSLGTIIFYEPQAGAILIDGHDTRHLNLKSLREQIGVVLQDPFLFNGTVADNIAYGHPAASLEQIVAATKAANAHDFVWTCPTGTTPWSASAAAAYLAASGSGCRLPGPFCAARAPLRSILAAATCAI